MNATEYRRIRSAARNLARGRAVGETRSDSIFRSALTLMSSFHGRKADPRYHNGMIAENMTDGRGMSRGLSGRAFYLRTVGTARRNGNLDVARALLAAIAERHSTFRANFPRD